MRSQTLTQNQFPSAVPFLTALVLSLLTAGTSVRAQELGWSVTGSLIETRVGHTATLLRDGKVLVVGGTRWLETFTSPYWNGKTGAEVYDPMTAQWTTTGSLSSPRSSPMAARLGNGKVLVLGGNDGYRIPVNTAELYDPHTGTWSAANHPSNVHSGGTATVLGDGRLLLAGGGDGGCCAYGIHGSSELYDPETNVWSPARTMNSPRKSHTAILLPSGKVLVVGGSPGVGAEVYDPSTDRWTLTGRLVEEHLWDHKAILLPSGKVLLAGGGINGDDYCNGITGAELYDPETGQWSPTANLLATRNDYYNKNNVTLLSNGRVLVSGGLSPGCNALSSSELYDPATESWNIGTSMTTARFGHTMTQLSDGRVLAVGGSGDNSAELYNDKDPTVTPERIFK